jgi:hypothetical protein
MTTNQSLFRSLLNGEDGAEIRKGLETSSASEIDAEARARAWDATFSNLDEIIEDRNYSSGGAAVAGAPGYSSLGLHGIEFFDATVAAMIKSYAGIFSVEKTMEQPNASLPYFNTYGVKTGNLITPNLGTSQTLTEADGYINESFTVAQANAGNAVIGNTAGSGAFNLESIPVVPGSVKITLTYDGASVVLSDDGAGNLMASAGILSAGTVNYGLADNTPIISFVSPTAGSATSDTDVSIEFVQDQPQELNESIKGELEYYTAKTAPIIVPYQVNQVANLSAKKALGINMRQMTLDQVTDEYTKIVNKKVVDQITLSANAKNESVLDLSNYTVATSDFRTYLESFMAQLKMVDTAMAKKTEKAVKITAYLVSLNLGDIFSQLDFVTSKWVPNKDMSYVDDIVGYYNEIPVVRSKYVTDSGPIFQGFAVHKTKEGHLAPLMRGIFLPLTNMDEVGSFNNPLLKQGGIFSYEGVSRLTNDLTIGFQVKPGVGTVIS